MNFSGYGTAPLIFDTLVEELNKLNLKLAMNHMGYVTEIKISENIYNRAFYEMLDRYSIGIPQFSKIPDEFPIATSTNNVIVKKET